MSNTGGAGVPRSKLEIAIGICALVCAVLTAIELVGSWWAFRDFAAIDRDVLLAVRHDALQPGPIWPVMKQAMLLATALGAFPTLALVTLVIAGWLAAKDERSIAIRLVAITGSGIATANLVKDVIGRPRPDVVEHWIAVSSLSFPSGHTADGSLVYLLLAVLATKLIDRRAVRTGLAAAAFLLIVLIGLSRVYLGVHYPSDVLAGWTFGTFWAFATAPILRTRRQHG